MPLPRSPAPTDADYDTDDLIEDARNFVLAASRKLVDQEDWAEIDDKRKRRRQQRAEKRRTGGRQPSNG